MSLPAGQQTTYSRRDRSSEVTDELASSRVTTPVQQQMYSEETTPTQASHDALYANVHIGRHTDRHDAAVHMYYNPPYNSDEWAFVNQLEEIDAHRLLLHRGAATAAIPQYASASDYVPQTKVELFDEPIMLPSGTVAAIEKAAAEQSRLWTQQPAPCSPIVQRPMYDDSHSPSMSEGAIIQGVSLLRGQRTLGDPLRHYGQDGFLVDKYDDPFVTPPGGVNESRAYTLSGGMLPYRGPYSA